MGKGCQATAGGKLEANDVHGKPERVSAELSRGGAIALATLEPNSGGHRLQFRPELTSNQHRREVADPVPEPLGEAAGNDMCGRPLRSKRNLERCGTWSGADMCAAFDAAHTPRAQMGVRGSGPIQGHALEALVAKLVFLIRSLDRAPSLSFDPPTPRQPRGCDGAYTAATGARYTPPLASSAQTMRAILLASATRTSMGGLRASMRPSHEPAGTPLRAAQRATALAPMISKRRSERSPILDVLPSRSLPPLER